MASCPSDGVETFVAKQNSEDIYSKQNKPDQAVKLLVRVGQGTIKQNV